MWKIIACLSLPFLTSMAVAQGYQVQPGDTLDLQVMEDPDMRRSVLVLPDGTVSVPLAGSMPASGLTVPQIEAQIRAAIGPNYVTQPTVQVSVARLAKAKPVVQRARQKTRVRGPSGMSVYAMGELGKPGKMTVTRGTTLLQLVAEAGGLTRFAASRRVVLKRADAKSKKMLSYRINVKAMMEGSAQMVQLKPGDIIVVPGRKLFE